MSETCPKCGTGRPQVEQLTHGCTRTTFGCGSWFVKQDGTGYEDWRQTPNCVALQERDKNVRLSAELAALKERCEWAVRALEEIVCVNEPDAGVVLLSNDGPTEYDPIAKCQVYKHQYFSPLGDALIALHEMLSPPNQSEE